VGDLRVCVFPGYRPKSICLAAPSARGTLADVSTAETTDQTPPSLVEASSRGGAVAVKDLP